MMTGARKLASAVVGHRFVSQQARVIVLVIVAPKLTSTYIQTPPRRPGHS